MADQRIDDHALEAHAEHEHRGGAREQEGEPQRRPDGDEQQHRECGEHHELALREVDDAGRLPQQREAERSERVDRAGRDARHDELNQVAHEVGEWRRPVPTRAVAAS
jgi:hypothetical protein